VIDLMLASLDKARTTASRYFILQGLDRFRNDPRARGVLEGISASDPDARLRQLAAEILQKAPAPAMSQAITGGAENGAGQPPRLGVQLNGLVGNPAGNVIVRAVGAGTVADKAGMRDGDLLLEINHTPIESLDQVPEIVQSLPRGVDVDVLVQRVGGAVNLKARF
jgi:S1-C subfamily serine protease